MNWLNFFKLRPEKLFSAWQIELTTRCLLRCRMCIREGIKDWKSADMDFESFKKLAPYFKYIETIVLEGWGESLLYKNLIDAIRLVKRQGAQVGFVTSGKGLDKNYIFELVEADVDFIGFSFAGATSRTHNHIRVNSDLDELIGHIQTFNEIKRDKRRKKPKLHIVYLMLKDNISEVLLLLDLAKTIGIEEVFLTNLIHVTNEWQERQRVFFDDNYQEVLKEAEAKAQELKIRLKRPSLSPIDVAVCEENPLRNLYISVDGEISPCVYLNPPVPSPFKRIFCGKEVEVERMSFGNIFRETFPDIWNNRKYTEFRDSFTKRTREISSLPKPPGQCRTCHKMLGA